MVRFKSSVPQDGMSAAHRQGRQWQPLVEVKKGDTESVAKIF